MIQIHLSLNPWLRLHALIGALNTYGGRIESTLVTEEDMSVRFLLGPFPEPVQFTGDGAGSGVDQIVPPGDWVQYNWDIALMGHTPMTPEHAERFRHHRARQ